MNILYRGGYQARWMAVARLIRDSERTVLELCFGDVMIAEYCRRSGRAWTGFDLSDEFVAHAAARGFDARQQDLQTIDVLPDCDVCVMMGSLYHFAPHLKALFQKIRRSSGRLILSEPVRNWTQSGGVLGFLAKKLTRAGKREEVFRFSEASLVRALESLRPEVRFDYRVASVARDMIVEVVWSK